MRPFPWILRVGLFALGFGVGLSHYKPLSVYRPIIIEHVEAKRDLQAIAAPQSLSRPLQCSSPVFQVHKISLQ
jgi:hypothetical protein